MLKVGRVRLTQAGHPFFLFMNFIFNYSWFLFSLALLLYVMYPSLIFGEFLFHDDLGSIRTICPFTPWLDTLGRPLGDKIACLQFSVLYYFGATATRVLTILSMLLIQVTTYKFLRREGFSDYLSVFMSFGILILPGMLVYASWITTAYIVFSLLFSAIAALLCQQILTQKTNKSIFTYFLFAMAILSELASDLTHQNGGMFFLVFFAIAVAQALYRDSSLYRTVFVYTIGFIPANLIYFIYFKMNIAATLAPQDPTRGILFRDFIGHLTWFFNFSLPRSVSLWFNVSSSGWTIISSFIFSIFIASLGVFIFSFIRYKKAQHAISKIILYTLFLFFIMLGCYLPTLVSSMYLDFFRALIPLSSFFFLMTCTHFSIGFHHKETMAKHSLIPLMVFIAFFANQTMSNQMIMPKYLEFQYLKNLVQQIKNSHMENMPIHVIRTTMLPETNGLNTDEIGCINTTFRGHGVVLVEYMREQLHLPHVIISDSRPGEPFDTKGKIVIDFSTLSLNSLKSDLENLPLKIIINPKIKSVA